jgi:flagellar motor switch protein FliG
MDDDGLVNSAILLMSIGEEQAAEVFRYLEPREAQRLGETMAKLRSVDRGRVEDVLSRFREAAGSQSSLVAEPGAFVKGVLERALGEDRAASVVGRIVQGPDPAGIEGLKWMEPAKTADLVREEHPQVIATILVHLDREQAAAILKALPDATRDDVVARIATLDEVQPAALRELDEVLARAQAGQERASAGAAGGPKAAAELLNFLGSGAEAAVVESIRARDPDLAQQIEDLLFVFDDLLALDDKGMQLVLREAQGDALVVALKGAGAELRDKVFRNMSSRAAETLRDDLESKGPVRLSEVEAQQKEILKIVRRLADDGQIVLGGGGGDDALV